MFELDEKMENFLIALMAVCSTLLFITGIISIGMIIYVRTTL